MTDDLRPMQVLGGPYAHCFDADDGRPQEGLMTTYRLSIAGAACAFLLAGTALAETVYSPPRTPDGKPDLQGVFTNASLTTLERPARFPSSVLSKEEAARMEAARARMMAASNQPTRPDEGAPTDGNANAGYNTFWMDPGSRYGVVRGETRSSWIIDPPDGRIPYSDTGRERFLNRLSMVRQTFDGPEIRPQGERCIVGFGSTAGPPMINVLYNNHYQIVQTSEHVVIMAEMINDARIIPVGKQRSGPLFDKWLGNSFGWWDGDTLVVETTGFHPDIRVRPNMSDSFYVGENPTVVERFTRVSPDEILYEFTVSDKDAFTQPWRGEMTLSRARGPIYEYACHEGNYALPGILAGARSDDRRGVRTVVGSDAE